MSNEKPKAARASVSVLRESVEIAGKLSKAGVAFVCVPYFTEEQKVNAAIMAAHNIESVDLGDDDE